MLEIPNANAAREFFQTEPISYQCGIAARAVLRALPSMAHGTYELKERATLSSLRAILVCAIRSAVDVDAKPFAAPAKRFAELVTVDLLNSKGPSSVNVYYFVDGASMAASSATKHERSNCAAGVSDALTLTGYAFPSLVKKYEPHTKGRTFSGTDRQFFGAVAADLAGEKLYSPLWPSDGTPEWVNAAKDEFLEAISSDRWRWWRNWYAQMWDGTFTDWDFAIEVAKLDWDAPEGESVWDRGAAAVAERIEALERDRARVPLDADQISAQALRLQAHPVATRAFASASIAVIERASFAYTRAANCNALPDGMERLPQLATRMAQIAELADAKAKIAELEAQIEALILQVAALTKDLEAARPNRASKFIDKSVDVSATILTTAFWGTLGAGLSHFIGVVDVGDLLDRLSNATSDLPAHEEAPWPKAPEA